MKILFFFFCTMVICFKTKSDPEVIDLSNADVDLDIGKGPIFWNGMIKYLNYYGAETFEKTNVFFVNRINNGTSLAFFGILMEKSLNILASKERDYKQTIDVISIEDIQNINEDSDFTTAISDIKEGGGLCFKILTKINLSWIVCNESLDQKTVLMTFIKKLKIKNQRMNGISIDKYRISSNDNGLSDLYDTKLRKKIVDPLGYALNNISNKTTTQWVTIQDWTECSLKCGGGKSFKQRKCISKYCDGPEILERLCNIHPCSEDRLSLNGTYTNIINKPVMKTMRFMNRPQRYEKCIIKEGDLLYSKLLHSKNGNTVTSPMPVRVVMNNRTISLFFSETYDSLVLSFDLMRTKFHESNKKFCFLLSENEKKETELCSFSFSKGDSIVSEWKDAINIFKSQCENKILTQDIELEVKKKMMKKIQVMKDEIIKEKQDMMNLNIEEMKSEEENQNVEKTSDIALEVLRKEVSIEERIRREEMEREHIEQLEITNQIEKEEKKTEIIMKALKEKEIEDRYNLDNLQKEKEIQLIKEKVKKEVELKRKELKDQVKKWRRNANLKKEELKNKLLNVRLKFQEKIKQKFKVGEENNCIQGKESPYYRNTYCQAVYTDDLTLLSDCRTINFCELCCDHEFGSAKLDLRNSCKDNCNKIVEKQENSLVKETYKDTIA